MSNRAKLLFWILFFALKSAGQTVQAHFKELRTEQPNLPAMGVCYNFYEDTDGFLWILGDNGAFRYDGHDFLAVKSGPLNLNSPASSRMRAMRQDDRGNFWFTTADQGLNSWDPRTGKFAQFHHDPKDPASLTTDNLLGMEKDGSGKLWIGSGHGLNHFDPKTGLNEQILPQPGTAGKLQGSPLSAIIVDANRVYLNTNAGFEYLDRKTGAWHFFPYFKKNGDNLLPSSIGIWANLPLCRDRNGLIWTGQPSGSRLQYFDPKTGEVSVFAPKNGPQSPKGDFTFIKEDHAGQLFAGNSAGELWRISPDRSKMEACGMVDALKGEDLRCGPINMFIDKNDLIWMGTDQEDRVFYIDPHQDMFQSQKLAPEVVGKTHVIGLFFENRDVLWYCTQTGLCRKDLATGGVQTFPNGAGLYCPVPIGRDKILLCDQRGLYIFDKNTKRFAPVSFAEFGLVDKVQTHAVDHDGDIWVSTWGKGLYRIPKEALDLETGRATKATRWKNDPQDAASLSFDYLVQVFVDSKNRVWACGANNGLNRVDKKTGRVQRFLYKQGEPNGISGNYTFFVLEDQKGALWVTSPANGLNRFDPETGIFKTFNMGNGMSSDRLFMLAMDEKGKIWLTNPNGLTCIDPATEAIVNYPKNIGHKIWSSPIAVRPGSDEVFFAQGGALVRFSPGARKNLPPNSTPMRISEVWGFDAGAKSMKSLPGTRWKDGPLTLAHDENRLEIKFALLELRNLDQRAYQYSLTTDAAAPQWVDLGAKNSVSLAQMAAGAYFFKAKGRNSVGEWVEMGQTLRIVVRPPWWNSRWAWAIYLLGLAAGGYFLYQYLLKQQREHAEAAKIKELDLLRTRLYTNITHEFRTPLTVILGMADQIRGHENERKLIARNGQNLLRLINQLLDLSKLDSGMMRLKTVRGDVINYLQYLTESFHSLATERGVRLVFYPETARLDMDFDEEKLQHVVFNLLSNALKFTENGGKVVLHAATVGHGHNVVEVLNLDDDKNANVKNRAFLQLKVQDTGAGIAEGQLPHIFDRFYQADNSATRKSEGTGIGLALTKELVELMGGSIGVESRVGQGSVFTVLLPLKTADGPRRPTAHVELAVPMNQVPSAVGRPPSAVSDRPLLLLIEDNADVVTYIVGILKNDYEVEVARNGREGIEKAFELVPDIVVSDVMMPEKDGFEVCETLKTDERTSHVPIILLTAKAAQEDKLAGLRVGADAYLQKPFDKNELFVRLEKLVEVRQKLQERYAKFNVGEVSNLDDVNPADVLPPTLDDLFLQKIRQVILEKMGDSDLGILHLCRAANLSHTQVFRKLKALTGENPTLFIRRMRLERAAELLKTTELNVSEIAYEVGFSDPNYFSRAFHEVFGEAPSGVRR